MTEFIKAAAVSDIPDGSMKSVTVKGVAVALANVGGQYFAVSDTCTHHQCSLGTEGFLDDGTITRGCHGAQFDVRTGKVLALPATTDLKTYPVKTEGNEILVQV